MFTLTIYTYYYTVIITIIVKSFVATAKVQFCSTFSKNVFRNEGVLNKALLKRNKKRFPFILHTPSCFSLFHRVSTADPTLYVLMCRRSGYIIYVVQKAVHLILSYPHKNLSLNNSFIYQFEQVDKYKTKKKIISSVLFKDV